MQRIGSVSFLALSAAVFGLSFAGAANAQAAFANWRDALQPGATVVVGGVSQEFTYTSGASGVTSVAPPSTNMAVTFTETLNAAGQITSLAVQNANRTVGFYRANGDTIDSIRDGQLIYARSSDWTRQALAADPTSRGWYFQSFGVWQGGLGQPNGSMGAASVGAITAGTSVPQTGLATFTGLMGGIYNDSRGQDHVVSAPMWLYMNFGGHSADFLTIGTTDRFGAAYYDLDIRGTFVSLPNHPALFGTLTTTTLTGTSSAQFYGPAADEVGGVFTMTPKTGQGLERLAGAFGGRRPGASTPGGATPPPPATGFASWSANLKPNASVEVSGKGQELTFTANANGVTTVSAPSAVQDVTFKETLSAAGAPTQVSIATPNRTVAFSQASGDTLGWLASDTRILVATSADKTRLALAADPMDFGWDYQSFGIWETTGATGSAGAVSVGAATAGSAIPTTGSATFRGVVGGVYLSAAGVDQLVGADMELSANFAARSATFTSLTFADLLTGAALSGSALSGTLTYSAGQNALSGTLRTANGRLSGTANARFYGPSAQEVGGLFMLAAGSGLERLGGAFGAKR